jgi:steroid delta-isomerase-like uncharacterized protein
MSEENKQLVRRYFEELDRGKAAPVHLCTADFAFHVAGFQSMDVEATKRFAAMFYSALPDLTHPIDELIAEGDKVAFRGRYEGTHTGDFMGVPPSGQHISVVGVGVFRVANGRVAEFWVSPDRMSLMQQVGALPVQEQASSVQRLS